MTDITSTRPIPGGSFPLADEEVARVGFGVMQLPRLGPQTDAAASVLRRALDAGVNHLDTAQFYGNGFANDVIRRVLDGRDDVLVASKVGADPDADAHLRVAQRPEQLRASVDDNLRSLGTDRIGLVYLRRLDAGPGLRATGDQAVALDDQLEVMTALRDEGKIGAIGLSGVSTEALRAAEPAGIAAVQNAYSVVDRSFEDMLRYTLDKQIAWVPFFPLGSAFPGHAKVVEQPAVREAAERLGATPSQLGLAWLLQHSANTLLIPGTASAAHLDENIAAASLSLDAATITALDSLEVVGGGDIRWTEA